MTDPAPSAEQATRALERLRILRPAQAITDPELNRALDPFRGRPPTALLCGNATCTRPFLWCGLDATTGRVRFGAQEPDDDWTPDEGAGESIAPPGEPMLRWRFRCRRCERPCVLTNARMIALIVDAITAGRTSIRPATD